MKKILLGILVVLGLFVVGCGKDSGFFSDNENKGRPRLEIQDVEVIELDGAKRIVKQIVVTPADEIEQDKLFEKSLKSKEELIKNFPELNPDDLENVFTVLNEDRAKLKQREEEKNAEGIEIYKEIYNRDKSLINLENEYNNFLKNNKELRTYMTEEQIAKLRDSFNLNVGNVDVKIEAFNNFLRYPEEIAKRL